MTAEQLKEVMRRWLNGETRQYFIGDKWSDCEPTDVCWSPMIEYRIKPSKKRVPLTQKDFPPVCWLRADDHSKLEKSVVAIGDGFVRTVAYDKMLDVAFSELKDNGWQYSSDRINWQPCSKEE